MACKPKVAKEPVTIQTYEATAKPAKDVVATSPAISGKAPLKPGVLRPSQSPNIGLPRKDVPKGLEVYTGIVSGEPVRGVASRPPPCPTPNYNRNCSPFTCGVD